VGGGGTGIVSQRNIMWREKGGRTSIHEPNPSFSSPLADGRDDILKYHPYLLAKSDSS